MTQIESPWTPLCEICDPIIDALKEAFCAYEVTFGPGGTECTFFRVQSDIFSCVMGDPDEQILTAFEQIFIHMARQVHDRYPWQKHSQIWMFVPLEYYMGIGNQKWHNIGPIRFRIITEHWSTKVLVETLVGVEK